MTDDGTRENASHEAVRLFTDGHNCAQAVLGALAPGLGLDRETAVRLATGFGIGLSMGETCGAVSGAVLALGLASGGGGPGGTEAKLATYALAGEFFDAFVQVRGGLRCRELIGCDPSTPEGMLMARTEDRFGTICSGLVGTAAAIAAEMLAKRSPSA
ncbi:C-GCAxxG-C-C family protein [Desulfolutivibrio sp.]|uniref:C-GCAxxG-C-C family protein n=1 Tax=Desulfolutivibrio sp. TaxID=2773296 RepID=UPI002F966CB7